MYGSQYQRFVNIQPPQYISNIPVYIDTTEEIYTSNNQNIPMEQLYTSQEQTYNSSGQNIPIPETNKNINTDSIVLSKKKIIFFISGMSIIILGLMIGIILMKFGF